MHLDREPAYYIQRLAHFRGALFTFRRWGSSKVILPADHGMFILKRAGPGEGPKGRPDSARRKTFIYAARVSTSASAAAGL